jgi:hypothetical protein
MQRPIPLRRQEIQKKTKEDKRRQKFKKFKAFNKTQSRVQKRKSIKDEYRNRKFYSRG